MGPTCTRNFLTVKGKQPADGETVQHGFYFAHWWFQRYLPDTNFAIGCKC